MTTQDSPSVGTADELLALAAEASGLSDFGDDDFRTGLEVLLSSFDADSQLTPHGLTIARAMVTKALVGRARSEAAFARHPEHTEVPIERPLFVCGLMRTGSTALHRLLSADPLHQGIETWLAEAPQPRPPRADWPANPDFQRSQAHFAARQAAEADLMKVHFMDADEVEECWQLLQQSMKSVALECVSYLPTYSRWLAAQDWTDAYSRHKKNLQLIGVNDPEKRWVLKNPSHVFALDEIMQVYPDALIIRTHRAPRTAMASTCSLVEQGKHDMSAALDRETIGRTQLDLWARGIEHFEAARRRYDPRQFLDVEYQDFVTDPLGTVAGIYDHFGLEFTSTAREAIEASHRKSLSAHRRPHHQYSLEDFGLTEAEVDERFGVLA